MAERDNNSTNRRETDKEGKENSVEQNIDYIPQKKLEGLPNSQESKKEIDKAKEEIDNFKKKITAKFKYIEAVGIVPMQAAAKIEEEYEVPEEEAKKKLMHLLIVIPEDKYTDMGKIKLESIELSKKMDQKIWVHILTHVDLWNLGLDSKFDVLEAFAMCFPLMDKGILGALRVTTVHKSLVLRKFEKYVTSYVIAGSLVRGTATETSDVDVFVVIDDTDVKRMSRFELKEKLRSIIYQYIAEAEAIAGVRNKISPQIYLLTDFWESVKDAHPVIFTFIRDGIPLYDRGAFMPWKSLLKQGRIKPSPEAIDMYMSSGDKIEERIKRSLLEIVINDLFWGVSTPSQALLMLYGLPPPNVYDLVKQIREVFVEKEKILEKKYADILDEICIKYYKGFEHNKIKEVSGAEVDRLTKDALDYMKRLKELREQIEKRIQEKTIVEVHKEVFGMLGAMLKKEGEEEIVKEFEDKLVKTGRFPAKFADNMRFIIKVKKEIEKEEKKAKKEKKKDLPKEKETKDVEKARKLALEITNALVEYNQRCDFLSMDRGRFIIKAKDNRTAEIFFLDTCFVISEGKVFTLKNGKLCISDIESLRKQLQEKQHKETKIDYEALQDLKKVFGDFELSY